MKLEIVERGVYGADGKELEVGATINVDSEDGEVPNQYANKARIIAMDGKHKKPDADEKAAEERDGKTAVTNPAKTDKGA